MEILPEDPNLAIRSNMQYEHNFLVKDHEACPPQLELATNLIINFLPLDFKESQLRQLFQEVGSIASVRIMKNRKTAKSKGYGFVKFAGHKDAQLAINQFNGMSIQGKQIKVAFSRPGGTRTHCNLFVSNLPKKWDNGDLGRLFETYGSLLECRVLKNVNGESRRCGFVRYDAALDAQRALKHMDGYLPKNARSSINVKLAERPSHEKKKFESKSATSMDKHFFHGAGGEPIPFSPHFTNPLAQKNDMSRMFTPELEHPNHISANDLTQMASRMPRMISEQGPPRSMINPHTAPHTAANMNAVNRMFMNTHLYNPRQQIAMTPPPTYVATSPAPNQAFLASQDSRSAAFGPPLNYAGFQSAMLEPSLSPPDYSRVNPTPDAFQTPPVPSGVPYGTPETFDGTMHRLQNMDVYLASPSPPPSRLQLTSQNMLVHLNNDHRQAAPAPVQIMTPEVVVEAIPKGVGKDTIFLSNLPSMFDEASIQTVCQPYGNIKMVTLQRDNTGASLGMAFVSYVTSRDAEIAVHRLNGTMMYNSKVMVRI